MMVGHQHANAEVVGLANARNAGHTVVDGNEQRRLSLRRDADDFLRQSIAVFEPVGNQVIDVGETESAQTANEQGRAGRTVHVVIANDNDALVAIRNNEFGRFVDAFERANRRQLR